MSDDVLYCDECDHVRECVVCGPKRAAERDRLAAEVGRLTTDAEMASGCLAMIRDVLMAAGCEHGPETHAATPAMLYPEWIACAMRKVRADERAAGQAAVDYAHAQRMAALEEGQALLQEKNRLTAENARLRAALQPFAEYSTARDAADAAARIVRSDTHSVVEYGSVSYGGRGYTITLGDCRAAAKAREGSDG